MINGRPLPVPWAAQLAELAIVEAELLQTAASQWGASRPGRLERGLPLAPEDLAEHDKQIMPRPGHPTAWKFKRPTRAEIIAPVKPRLAGNDIVILKQAAQDGLGNSTGAKLGEIGIATAESVSVAAPTAREAQKGSFCYSPKANFFGSDSFDYRVFDADGDMNTGPVALNVQDVPETEPEPPPTSGLEASASAPPRQKPLS
jgi:hypothetical protein